MGITIFKEPYCCNRNNAILLTHNINNDDIKSNNINKIIYEDNIDNKYKEKNKNNKKVLLKTGVLDYNIIEKNEKINEDFICINGYHNDNNFFYYLKKVKLIQKKYKEYCKRKLKKKQNKNNNYDKNLKESTVIEQENNLYLTVIRTNKLTELNLLKKLKDSTIETVPFNLKSKKNIKYTYHGKLITKKIEYSPQINGFKSKFYKRKESNEKLINIKQGYGKIKYKDESEFEGIFKNNKANGIGKYIDNLNRKYIGEYKNNEPKGYGIYNNNENELEGIYNGNFMEGIGIERNNDGTYYEGEFTLSEKNGIGTFKWRDGTIYQGNFINNEMTGYGIIEYNDGKLYQGSLINGSMNGYGEFYWDGNKRYNGYYKDDKRCGFGIFIWDFDPIEAYIGFFNNGLFDGVGMKISGNKVKYGIFKKQEIEQWLKGPWEFQYHIFEKENLKYMNIFQMKHNKLFEYILKFSNNEIHYTNDENKQENYKRFDPLSKNQL